MKKLFLLLFLIINISFISNAFASVSISPLKHEITIEQWKSIKKSIKITNEWEEALTLYTSTEDFISWDTSWKPKFIKPEDQDNPELSLANWVEIEDQNITLSPWETREINFEINIPNSWEPGWHYGAVFFSPWIKNDGNVAFAQRIWVLLLIDIPWEIVIDWELNNFEVWEIKEDKTFENNSNFENLPIVFQTTFENKWNIHLKPKGKIELIDEDWNLLENIGKEILFSPTWTFIWEKLVDYIPVNEVEWNVLPKSTRIFDSYWRGFWYKVINEDWTSKVEFKDINEYYSDKASEKAEYLMFWEQIHTKKVKKQITANYNIYYKSKNQEQKEFIDSKNFTLEYNQKYIWINYFLVWFILIIIAWVWYYFIVQMPKSRAKREEELKKKIMEEMKNNK